MIRSLSEKKGGTRSIGRDSIAFHNFINNMSLVDTKTNNGIFTWNNRRGGASQVAYKLDRFIIFEDLILTGNDLSAMILPFGGLDHWPIQLEVPFIGTPRNRPFRFENIWLTHPDFIGNIEKWWRKYLHVQGTKMSLLYHRLKHIKLRLKNWNKNEFGNIFKAKKVVERKLQEINQISTHKEVEAALVQHFQVIAEEPLIDRTQFINDFTKHIPKLVTREDNYNINRPVNEEEVSEVIKEMQNWKAPSLDGFNVDFFKACWKIVKPDILEVVEDSRKNKIVLKVLKTSFIALIPKQENAMTPDRFRPIALCNVVYKIISKIIANRLKPLLPTLVSEEKTRYVEGRQILNNIIQAHEVVHSLKSNKQAGMIIQLDLEKAYDKISWAYIREVLIAYGFDHNYIRWVMALVTTSIFSILLNGSPSKPFKPSRGLRQGNPLSPFLFILMMEGLGNVIKSAKAEGKIQGLKLTLNGDALTHQQLVDDTMLQDTPMVKEAPAFKQILNDFAMATGTKVSLTKPKILFFNTNISI
eukprot:PITA_33434